MWEDELNFLKLFPKDANGLYRVHDLYPFDSIFQLLLKNNFEHGEALSFILANCALSVIVFQERIHNRRYLSLSSEDDL